MLSNDIGCECYKCRGACRRRPGWFLPVEAEIAADLLEMSLLEFFRKYLGVDWYVRGIGARDTFLLAPAIIGMTPGEEYPWNPTGICIFFVGRSCLIHAAKPFECEKYAHNDTHKQTQKRRETVADKWALEEHQRQIERLLGREPDRHHWRTSLKDTASNS